MSNSSTPKKATCFKYKFTTTMIVLLIVALALCVAGLIVSIFRIRNEGVHGFTDALQSPLLIAICVFAIVFIISVLIKSQYVVTDKHYVSQFGFVKSRFLIKDVTKIELDSDTKKLTVFVGEQFMILSLPPEQNDAFVQAMREVNKDIDFSFTLATAQEEDKK
ncbi:MAG: hypothetical protein IJD33_00525 [Clostridia bacterium]|nr:hypothetical protein [Clostridia bacterium]